MARGQQHGFRKYSGGLTIELLVESINKITYGEEVDSFIKETLKN